MKKVAIGELPVGTHEQNIWDRIFPCGYRKTKFFNLRLFSAGVV